jgi:ABC-type transport system involved in multi-copper enzyme maturation permease subunit
MDLSLSTLLTYVVLASIQVLAAVPWLLVALPATAGRPSSRRGERGVPDWVVRLAIRAAIVLVTALLVPLFATGQSALRTLGQLYGVVLQLQLAADFFIGLFALLLVVWPKGGAVALAAFREGIRQPMYWLIFAGAALWLLLMVFVPMFTFGEDHIMMRDIDYDTIMLAGVLFGALAASLSISEEIEGRTAVTLMSKPVSRRQFLLGKFVGIALTSLSLFALLGTEFEGMTHLKEWWDQPDPVPPPAWIAGLQQHLDLPRQPADFVQGVCLWTALTLDVLPGLILGFAQVMVLVAIAVSLATRVPMVVNLVSVFAVYLLANLAPVLAIRAREVQASSPGTVAQLLNFMARLFDTLLPDLGSFRLDAALLAEAPMPAAAFSQYIGSVLLYGVLYTGIVLLFGLILFEDRDLA